MKKNIMVIINPQSGKSDGKNFSDKLEKQLKNNFDEVRIEFTKDEGHGTELAKKACEENYDSIAAVGGDGTLAEVVSGMVDYDNTPKLLVIPGGTGNIMSKSLEIDQNKETTVENIDFSRTKKINIGKVGYKIFTFLLSIGDIPESLNSVSNEEKEKYGFFAYVGKLFDSVSKDHTYNLTVDVDGKEYSGEVNHLFILTSKKYGNVEIKEIENDDNLHVFMLKKKGVFEKAKAGIDMFMGNLEENQGIEYMSGEKVIIKTNESEDVNTDLDGDKGPKLPLEINLIKDKIEVYLPYEK